jgi:MBG domain (YGX type)/Bacterial Ig-like domain (group 3)/FG-GAP repeat
LNPIHSTRTLHYVGSIVGAGLVAAALVPPVAGGGISSVLAASHVGSAAGSQVVAGPLPGPAAEQSSGLAVPASLAKAIAGNLGQGAGTGRLRTWQHVRGGFAVSAGFDQVRATLRTNGLQLSSAVPARSWFMSLVPESYGRSRLTDLGSVSPRAAGSRVEYRFPDMKAWYRSTAAGLEQGFTLSRRPSGTSGIPLSIVIKVAGNLRLEGRAAGEVSFARNGRSVVRYGGLRAVDSGGKLLPSRLTVGAGTVRLVLDDSRARYPITIDPYFFINELTASDGGPRDFFGFAVALSADGTVALVGAPFHTVNNIAHSGAVYVFQRNSSGYTLTGELLPSDGSANDGFGSSVALSTDGSVAVVGAESHGAKTVAGAGAAYVFNRKASGFTQQAEITASDAAEGDAFGYAVALGANGSTIVVGAPGRRDGGAAYVFGHQGPNYKEIGRLSASGATTGDGFGSAVALSADGVWALVGAPNYSVNGSQPGAAFAFRRNGEQIAGFAKLTASDGMDVDGFGSTVAFSENGAIALVGAPFHSVGSTSAQGSAYIFRRNAKAYAQTTELTASDGGDVDNFGSSVALNANGASAMVGAPQHTAHNISGEGTAYVFKDDGAGYVETGELIPAGGAAGDGSGSSVALSASGKYALVGSPYHVASGNRGGAASFFTNLAATTTSISLTSGSNPSRYGETVAFTASESPAPGPSGLVRFWNGTPGTPGSVVLGDSTLSRGHASIRTGQLKAGPRHIYAVYGGDSDFAPSVGSTDITVNPAALSISAERHSVVFGAQMPEFTFTTTGFVNGDSLASLESRPTCGTTATQDGFGRDASPMGTYPITCSGGADSNYSFSYRPATLTVLPAALSVTASSPSTVYGKPIPRVLPIYKGLVDSQIKPKVPPVCHTTATARSGAGVYPTSCSGARDRNYAITYYEGSLKINRAHLRIKPFSLLLPYGHRVRRFGWEGNFVKGDSSASLTAQPKCTTTAQLDKKRNIVGPAGKYSISCSGAAAKNYIIRYKPGALTVTLAQIGIKYSGDRIIRIGQPASLSAYLFTTSSAPVAGRTVVLSLGAGASAQSCETAVTDARGYGACTITSVQQPKGDVTVTMRFAGDPAGPTYDFARSKARTTIRVRK